MSNGYGFHYGPCNKNSGWAPLAIIITLILLIGGSAKAIASTIGELITIIGIAVGSIFVIGISAGIYLFIHNKKATGIHYLVRENERAPLIQLTPEVIEAIKRHELPYFNSNAALKMALNAQYGKEKVTEMDAVSAYPPEILDGKVIK